VPIDIVHERLLSLAEASRFLPGRPHASSIFRWMSRGIRGVQLESCLIGGRRYTSEEALERFAAATTAAAAGETPPSRTPRARQRAIEEAERRVALTPRHKRTGRARREACGDRDGCDEL
jgi:hypothetical protein